MKNEDKRKQLIAVLKNELEIAKKMPIPMTRAELNGLGCSDPNCTADHSVIYFHQRCHQDAGTWTSFDKTTGVLTVECAECRKPIADILVANSTNAAKADEMA
jgi:hypothetical protein